MGPVEMNVFAGVVAWHRAAAVAVSGLVLASSACVKTPEAPPRQPCPPCAAMGPPIVPVVPTAPAPTSAPQGAAAARPFSIRNQCDRLREGPLRGSFYVFVGIPTNGVTELYRVDCSYPPPGSVNGVRCESVVINFGGVEKGEGLNYMNVRLLPGLEIVSDAPSVVVLKKNELTLTVDFAAGVVRYALDGGKAIRAEVSCESTYNQSRPGDAG